MAETLRRLGELSYPSSGPIDLDDPTQIARIISYLEDRVIRQWDIEQRLPLRQFNSEFGPCFASYLMELECPYDFISIKDESTSEIINWLVMEAIDLNYNENRNSSKMKLDESNQTSSCEVSIDVEQEIGLLRSIAADLGMDSRWISSASPLDLWKAVYTGLRIELSEDTGKQSQDDLINRLSLGTTSGSDETDNQAKLQLLVHLSDMKLLSCDVCEVISRAQEFTANPKTDTRLGLVGK